MYISNWLRLNKMYCKAEHVIGTFLSHDFIKSAPFVITFILNLMWYLLANMQCSHAHSTVEGRQWYHVQTRKNWYQ